MSIIHMSSSGQNPANFFNTFNRSVQLPKHSEVRVLGYSGMVADVNGTNSRDNQQFFVVTEGQNDSFVGIHGTVENNEYYQTVPFAVKVKSGTYLMDNNAVSQTSVNNEMCLALERALNENDNCHEYFSRPGNLLTGWGVQYQPTVSNSNFKISLIQGQNTRQDGGHWDFYGDTLGTVAPPLAAPGFTELTPGKTTPFPGSPDTHLGGLFINRRAGYLGDCGQALGYAGPQTTGYTVKFQTTGNYKDLAFTSCIVPHSFLTTWELGDQSSSSWDQQKMNINRVPGRVATNETDWAFPSAPFPFATFGMTVNPITGQVGLLTSNMKSSSAEALKNPVNQNIVWTTTVVIAGVGQTIRFCMSPRYNPTALEYEIEYLCDNGSGTYVTLGSASMGSYTDGDFRDLMSAEKVFHCVHYNTDYVTLNSATVSAQTMNKWDNQVAIAPSLTEATLIYKPLTAELVNLPKRLETFSNFTLENCNNLMSEVGYNSYYEMSTPLAAGGAWDWISDGHNDGAKHSSATPLIITCPTLSSIEGYMGGAGGADSCILAVATLRGKVVDNAFSGLTQDTWIKINNEHNLSLDRLNIVLKDQKNRDYIGLLPDFSLWLQFRCEKPHRIYRDSMSVGNNTVY